MHCPRGRGFARRFARVCVLSIIAILLFVSLVVASIQTGGLDRLLADGARKALDAGLSPQFSASIGTTSIRFSKDLRLLIEASDVVARHNDSDLVLAQAKSVKFVLKTTALFVGKVEVDEIAADDMVIDAAVMPSGPPVDFSKFRVDATPTVVEHAFAELDNAKSFIANAGLDRVRMSNVRIKVPGRGQNPLDVGIVDLVLQRNADSALLADGILTVKGQPATFHVESSVKGDVTSAMKVRVADLDVAPILLRRDDSGAIRQGFGGVTGVSIDAERAGSGRTPLLTASVKSANGIFYIDGKSQEVTSADIRLGYDFTKNTLEVRRSNVVFGATTMPFSGALIDLDRLDTTYKPGSGIGIDLLVKDGVASAENSGEAPVPFDLKLFGRYLYDSREFQADKLAVSTRGGAMTGSLRAQFGDQSPELSFSAQFSQIHTSVVKQLWPYWIADKPRDWVMSNLFGGTITNASVDVFIPAGRMKLEPSPLHLGENELRLSFDIENTRANVTGDIPPVRDTDAHVEMVGGHLTVTFKEGVSYFPSGRTVSLSGGSLTIEDAYSKPLMADIDISVAGAAEAVAELVSYKPIGALEKAGFSISDFTGAVKAHARVRAGLVRSQDPPPPEWEAKLDLNKVNVAKDFSGRKLSELDATLEIDPSAARLKGKGLLDGVPMEIHMVEPVDKALGAKRERVVTLTLDNDGRKRLTPGLDDILQGSMKAELTYVSDTEWRVRADLGSAVLSLPWAGWSKGRGIAAKADFDLLQRDGSTHVDNLTLTGDGFGAAGNLVVGTSGLTSADIDSMKLSASDSFSVRVRKSGGGYQVKVNGKSVDVRSVIAEIKAPGDGQGDGTSAKSVPISVEAKLDRVTGFAGETLSSVNFVYGNGGGRVTALNLSAVTDNGQAVIAKLAAGQNGDELSLTSSDAGSILRFINLYTRMRGGLLNLKLMSPDNKNWNGSVDIRSFRVENEERLQSIVSSPAGADGQSLNNAVKRDIDISSEKFQRGFALIALNNGSVSLDNGVVRGEQIGATFQGTIRDAAGNMDMTGTFMPAYGLNRLFGELPVIGLLLGNGRDRGLLGITFKLTGPTSAPRLTINPLSIIAPGVFRSIFEFR